MLSLPFSKVSFVTDVLSSKAAGIWSCRNCQLPKWSRPRNPHANPSCCLRTTWSIDTTWKEFCQGEFYGSFDFVGEVYGSRFRTGAFEEFRLEQIVLIRLSLPAVPKYHAFIDKLVGDCYGSVSAGFEGQDFRLCRHYRSVIFFECC